MIFLNQIPEFVFNAMFGAGLLGFLAILALEVLPSFVLPKQTKLGLLIGTFAALALGGYMSGSYAEKLEWLEKLEQLKHEEQAKQKDSKEVTKETVIQYKTKVKTIKEKGDAIIREVPIYIQDDDRCDIPNSFVMLHNHAAKNEVPDSSIRVDDSSSGIKLSEVGTTLTVNYTTYHLVSEQLRQLQDWIREQNKIYNQD